MIAGPSPLEPPPCPDLGLAVVIPCHDEPDLPGTLRSLMACDRPTCATEVITVLNHAIHAPSAIRERHRQTLQAASSWAETHADSRLAFHFLDHPDLPERHAGVGLARKLGMDRAMARLYAVGRPHGVIASLDADCRVAPDYLQALERHFANDPRTPGCAIHFRHELDGLPARQRAGIAAYELSLRYIVAGWRYCGLPNAFHTVGSAMAVRAESYRRQGGMNRRQAGEDFYFLQKIMALGGFTDLTATTVFPSARVSHRVPFGTGRAMAAWMAGEEEVYRVWHPEVFAIMRPFFADVARLHDDDAALPAAGSPLGRFLEHVDFDDVLKILRDNTASPAAFRKRFFHWFDGFRFLKWAHWARDHGLAEQPVGEAARTLLAWHGLPAPGAGVEALLAIYDRLERLPLRTGR
ncbi:MAG: glycosyltransferase [Magnetococcales bacterium]|nr:glycosyltransferase [Magnetococcales bacterium]